MALGCFPIVGEIESVREWIVDGVNGYLVDPGHAPQVAEMIIRALADDPLMRIAAEKNHHIINTRAERQIVANMVENYYRQFLQIR
jgi:glycosyltransferase involved in cell wall biosynthesis